MKKMLFLLGIIFVLASCTHNYISTEEWQNEATQTPITTFTQVITASPSATVIDNSSECLPPIKDFEYTLDVEPPTEAIPLIDKVLPSSSKWQMVLNLPDYSSLELVQTINNRTIFWIYTGGRQFVRYQVYGNDWENGDYINGPSKSQLKVFHDRENNVWGARYSELDEHEKPPVALLNYYNEQNNKWEPVTLNLDDQDELAIYQIEVDQDGMFWLLVESKDEFLLYGLDPRTMTIKRHLQDHLVKPPFTISNNTIYILAYHTDEGVEPGYDLIEYVINDEQAVWDYVPWDFYHPYSDNPMSSCSLPNSLFVDSHHRVWFGADGWREATGDGSYDWHVIIKDPVFIDIVPGAGKWVWVEPRIMMESTDGLIWFNSLRGTGWVDPVKGKWCVITSYESNVMADRYGNLWLIAGKWLFRRK